VVLPWYKERRSVLIAALGAVAALFFAGLAFKRHHELVLSHASWKTSRPAHRRIETS